MDLESILVDYGKSMNLGKLQLDSSGICTLLINDHYLVTFEKSLDKDGFYIYSSIGTIPIGKESELGLMVLKGNLFGKETGQANIGYDEQSRTLVLFEYFDNNTIDYPQFSHRFNHFLQYLFYWIVNLEAGGQTSEIHHEKDVHLSKDQKKIFYA